MCCINNKINEVCRMQAYRNGIKNILNAYAEYTDITVSDITPRA